MPSNNTPRMLMLYPRLGDDKQCKWVHKAHRILVEGFDCVEVECGGDLGVQIEKVQPDCILILSAYETRHPAQQPITQNSRAYPEIPRIGYLPNDNYSPLFSVGFNYLIQMGCEAICSYMLSSGVRPWMHFDNIIYTMPKYDNNIFKDYGGQKDIPIGAFGAGFTGYRPSYPWRSEMFTVLHDNVAMLHAPRIQSHNMAANICGEDYAKMVNRCLFALGGISYNQTFTQAKNFEIPACRTCLITEDAPLLRELGFRDMENCIFATRANVLERIFQLLDNRTRLQEITDAGYAFAEKFNQRKNAILEWYELRKKVSPGNKIVQISPVKPLEILPEKEAKDASFKLNDRLLNEWLVGFQLILKGDIKSARDAFSNVFVKYDYCAEARTGQAICALLDGNLQEAANNLMINIHFVRNLGGVQDVIDPVDWAYLIVIHIAAKQYEKAQELCNSFAWMQHPFLQAARNITTAITQTNFDDYASHVEQSYNCGSRCPIVMTYGNWLNHIADIFMKFRNENAAVIARRFSSQYQKDAPARSCNAST